jgi:hypothetical protein
MPDVVSVVAGIGVAAVGWVALNFFGKPVLTLIEKRREALEIGERYAYVGLPPSPSDEYRSRALTALNNIGSSMRALARERSLATRIYCWAMRYDLDKAASALLGLSEAARGQYQYKERTLRLTLHVLFVALGSSHHLSAGEVAAAREEMHRWHDGNRNLTVDDKDKTYMVADTGLIDLGRKLPPDVEHKI